MRLVRLCAGEALSRSKQMKLLIEKGLSFDQAKDSVVDRQARMYRANIAATTSRRPKDGWKPMKRGGMSYDQSLEMRSIQKLDELHKAHWHRLGARGPLSFEEQQDTGKYWKSRKALADKAYDMASASIETNAKSGAEKGGRLDRDLKSHQSNMQGWWREIHDKQRDDEIATSWPKRQEAIRSGKYFEDPTKDTYKKWRSTAKINATDPGDFERQEQDHFTKRKYQEQHQREVNQKYLGDSIKKFAPKPTKTSTGTPMKNKKVNEIRNILEKKAHGSQQPERPMRDPIEGGGGSRPTGNPWHITRLLGKAFKKKPAMKGSKTGAIRLPGSNTTLGRGKLPVIKQNVNARGHVSTTAGTVHRAGKAGFKQQLSGFRQGLSNKPFDSTPKDAIKVHKRKYSLPSRIYGGEMQPALKTGQQIKTTPGPITRQTHPRGLKPKPGQFNTPVRTGTERNIPQGRTGFAVGKAVRATGIPYGLKNPIKTATAGGLLKYLSTPKEGEDPATGKKTTPAQRVGQTAADVVNLGPNVWNKSIQKVLQYTRPNALNKYNKVTGQLSQGELGDAARELGAGEGVAGAADAVKGAVDKWKNKPKWAGTKKSPTQPEIDAMPGGDLKPRSDSSSGGGSSAGGGPSGGASNKPKPKPIVKVKKLRNPQPKMR